MSRDARADDEQRLGMAIAHGLRAEMPGLAALVVQTWADADVPISYTPFGAEGAGVLQVSRALQRAVSAVAHVYLHAAVVIGYARQSQPARKRQAREDEAVSRLCAMLRHLALRARVGDELPVITRLTPPLESSAEALGQWSLAFVLAHELELVAGAREQDADAAASGRLRSRMAAAGNEAATAEPPALTGIGTVHLLERSVLVRPAPRHPTVDARWNAIRAAHGDTGDGATIAGWFVSAVGIAADLDRTFDVSFLRLLQKGEMLALTRDNIAWTVRWNDLLGTPLDELAERMRREATPAGRAVLGGLADGRVGDALAAVAGEETVERVLDATSSVTFPAPLALFTASTGPLTTGDADGFAAVAARLAERHLRTG